MLNYNFLICAKAEIGLGSLYCFKCGKISKSRRDLDLDRTMPNVKLIRAIFINYNMCKFQVNQTIIYVHTCPLNLVCHFNCPD